MEAKLNLQIQGPDGGKVYNKDNQGYVAAFIDHDNDHRIIIDSFSGHGNKYKRRKSTQIVVANDRMEWVGSFKDLCEILKIK